MKKLNIFGKKDPEILHSVESNSRQGQSAIIYNSRDWKIPRFQHNRLHTKVKGGAPPSPPPAL